MRKSIFVRVAQKTDYEKIIRFPKKIYKGNPYYRDHQTAVLKALLGNRMEIQKSSEIVPIVAVDSEQIVGIAFLAVIDRMSDYVQIAYLEMEQNPKIAEAIVQYAKEFARERAIKKLLIGLNFHVNYGLGLLARDFDREQSIGSSYNPKYYIDYLQPMASRTKILQSFKGEVADLDLGLSPAMKRRIEEFDVRCADFRNVEQTARIYGQINNSAFVKHDYYYESRLNEDIELFNEYKVFLKPENLLFAYRGEEPVGFVLWYPDFYQLLDGGQALGVSAWLKSKFLPHQIDTVKLTEFGVIPKYQRTAAIYALLTHCYKINKGKYKYLESGWILSDNTASKNLTTKFLKQENKVYKVFEMDL